MYAQVMTREPKHPDEERFPLRASKSVMDRMRALAFLQGDSVNDVIVQAMECFWAHHPKRPLVESAGDEGLKLIAKKRRRK